MRSLIITLFVLVSVSLKAQIVSSQLISSGGGSYVQSNAKIEWTIGDVSIETYQKSNYLTQGFLQGSSKIVAGINDVTNSINRNYNVLVYPNPSERIFNLNFSGVSLTDKVYIIVYDLLGKMIYHENCTPQDKEINLETVAPGMYILSVSINNDSPTIFKVNKL